MTSQEGAMLSDGIISPPSSFNHTLSLIQVNGGYKSESMRDGIVKQCGVGGGRERERKCVRVCVCAGSLVLGCRCSAVTAGDRRDRVRQVRRASPPSPHHYFRRRSPPAPSSSSPEGEGIFCQGNSGHANIILIQLQNE